MRLRSDMLTDPQLHRPTPCCPAARADAEEAGPEQTSMRLRTGKDEPALVGMQLPNEACALAGRLKLLGEEKAAGAQADA